MIIETDSQWCTTCVGCSKLVELFAERLDCGWRKERGPGFYYLDVSPPQVLFVGNVPRTSGKDRPDSKKVFLVTTGAKRLLVSGDTLGDVVDQLVNKLFG